jgi:hypothetical protein
MALRQPALYYFIHAVQLLQLFQQNQYFPGILPGYCPGEINIIPEFS